MVVNMAQKRAKKAQRRKQLATLAKREDAIHNTLPARVARATQTTIQHCYVNEGLFEIGMGTLLLARGHTSPLNVAVFLLDSFALGVKDVMFRTMDGEQIEQYLDMADSGSTMVPIVPSEARKLLRDLTAWSKEHGFAPHRDFVAVEKIFGDVNADDSDRAFRFGRDGKPVLISDPFDSDADLLLDDEALQTALVDQSDAKDHDDAG
jgi:F0F1-type ATP synthase assembly protein I